MTGSPIRVGEESDDLEARRRGRYLNRVHPELDERIAEAVAFRELGYSHSEIASKMDVTEHTARNWMESVAERYGSRAIETKWGKQRTGRLDQ